MTVRTAAGVAPLALAALALLATPVAPARGDFITNGGFETTSNGLGMPDFNTTLTGWTSPDTSFANQTGYNFLFALPSADTTGSPGYNGNIALYGPGNGFNNGLTVSPAGGSFFGGDGDTRYRGRLEQVVTGLTPGQQYWLGFWWAGAQAFGEGGTPDYQWDVTFGGVTQSTAVKTLPAPGGFIPWEYQTMLFTATSGTETLTFLADAQGPFGGPPFVLLDGVSLQAVPEPGSVLLAGVGLFAAGAYRRLRRRAAAN